ncbi:PDZ domain-containing protein [bacterium]|nr:PDZ domain-containing protein [bacterium]
MFALKAAGRTVLILLSLTLLLAGPALAKDGQGYLGVSLQDLTPSMAKALQLGDRQGVLVNRVMDDSPAEEAGLEDGDVILEFAGRAIEDNGDLTKAVRKTDPGEKVDVLVLRDGKEKTLAVTMGEHEGSTWFQMDGKEFDLKGLEDLKGLKGFHMFSGDAEDRGFLGIHMEDLSPQLGDYFGVKDGEGVLLTEVVAESPAEKAGLKAGDVIVKIGDERIASTSDLHEAMAGTEPDQELEVAVKREGKDKSFKVTLGEAPESEFVRGPGHAFFEGKNLHLTGPRMKMMLDGEDGDQMIIRRARPDREIEIERLAPPSEDLDQVRKELEQLRQELKELRQELKKAE